MYICIYCGETKTTRAPCENCGSLVDNWSPIEEMMSRDVEADFINQTI